MFNARSVGLGARRELHEGVAVPTVTYGVETLSMRMDKRQKPDAMKTK